MNNAIRFNSEANYQADLKVLQDKFAQTIGVGVRQIAILADDAANVGGNNYTKLLTDMVAWLKEMKKTYPDLKTTLPFVTQEYMGNGMSYFANFPKEVQIVMTGGRVWGEVSQNFTDTFTSNVGRGPTMWINWPCSDMNRNTAYQYLVMGGQNNFLKPGATYAPTTASCSTRCSSPSRARSASSATPPTRGTSGGARARPTRHGRIRSRSSTTTPLCRPPRRTRCVSCPSTPSTRTWIRASPRCRSPWTWLPH